MNEDKASRYHRLKRRASLVSLAWGAGLLVAALLAGFSVTFRNVSWTLSTAALPHSLVPAGVVLVYVVLLSILNELGGLPISFYSGFLLERRYGLSNEGFGRWAGDELKALLVGIVLGSTAAGILYFFITRWPESWWLPAGTTFAGLVVGLTNLAPVLLLPLFYTVKPLDRDSLRARLLALAERAGARVVGAYEWGLSAKTKKANAALAGLGRTRRILVSDTMLSEYSDEEIEVVLAHELGHHVHADIWKGIVFETVLIFGGFYLAEQALIVGGPPLGLAGSADVAGLPLLLLAAGALSIVMVPLALALSRRYERGADRFALDLTKNPTAFISAMRRLGAQNLAEDDPSRLVQWLFYSHPPIRERIAAAQAFPHP